MKLFDVLSKLKDTYRSIDLYVASAKYEDRWLNLLTLVRFSDEEYDAINSQIAGNAILCKLGKGNLVRMNRRAFSLEYLQELASDISKGELKVDGETVHITPVDIIANFDLNLQRSYPQNKNWGLFSSIRNRTNESPYNLSLFYDNLKLELIPLGAADIYEAIRNYFKVDYNSSTNIYDLAIEAPIYAKIKSLELLGKILQVKVTHHRNMRGLILHYDRHHYLSGQKAIEKIVYDQSSGKISQCGEFIDWEVKLEELNMARQSYENIVCDVSLFVNEISNEISCYDIHVTQMIAEKKLLDTNPLAKVFARFCSIEEFTKLLTNPINVTKSGFKLDKSDNFERVVYWLFSLNGFQTIWLGDYEVIDDQKHTVGSADLLCYSSTEKVLAVVSCKIKVPEADDIDKIKNLAERIDLDLKELGIRAIPIIVSSEPCDTVKTINSKNNVNVIDANDIRNIISKLYELPSSPRLFLRDLNTSD